MLHRFASAKIPPTDPDRPGIRADMRGKDAGARDFAENS
jgi:hypothetical protein